MTPQDLADRLEKAKHAIRPYAWQSLTDEERVELREEFFATFDNNLPAILASLRRSAPASGEMGEAAEIADVARDSIAKMRKRHAAQISKLEEAIAPFARVYRLLHPNSKREDEAGLRDHLPGIWPTVGDARRANEAIQALRTPSGETGEEAGS